MANLGTNKNVVRNLLSASPQSFYARLDVEFGFISLFVIDETLQDLMFDFELVSKGHKTAAEIVW